MATINDNWISFPFLNNNNDNIATLKIALSNNCLITLGNLGFAREPYKTKNKLTKEKRVGLECNGSNTKKKL